MKMNDEEKTSGKTPEAPEKWEGPAAFWSAWNALLGRVREAEAKAAGNYDLPCDRCGGAHYIDTVIPSETWNLIVGRDEPDGDKWGLLCTDCIAELCNERGITVEAEFYASRPGLISRLYPDALQQPKAGA